MCPDFRATRYFDNMLCAVASAIRGFSVSRDLFQTNWESLKAEREAGLKQIERLDSFAPLNKEGIWGIVVAAIVGIGLGAPLTEALKVRWQNSTLVSLVLIAALIGISIVALQAVIEWIKGRRLRDVEQQLPLETLGYWEEKSLKSYRTILRQFLPIAIEISNHHYPGSVPTDLSEDAIVQMVERHFAFKQKAKVQESTQP